MEGGDADRHPQRRGRPHHAVRRGLHQGRRAARRPGGQAPGRHQPREHHLLDQALHGPQVLRGQRRERRWSPTRSSPAANGDVRVEVRGKQLLAARDLRDDPAEAEADRRGLPRREGRPRPSSPSPPTSTTRSARPPRTRARSRASTCCASSTSPRRPRWPTAWTRRRTRRSPSTTSAAAPSTSRCSRSARAWSRSRPPTATPTWAATTSTSASSTGSWPSSRRTRASTSARTRWPCSG